MLIVTLQVIVVMEHLSGGELFDLVATEEFQLTEGQCRRFIRQVGKTERLNETTRLQSRFPFSFPLWEFLFSDQSDGLFLKHRCRPLIQVLFSQKTLDQRSNCNRYL